MKKLLVVIFIAFTYMAMAQETATVFIARKKLYTGPVYGPIKVFMDDKLICQINNNSFSVHNVAPGKHRFSAQWDGKESKEGASKDAIEIEVIAGTEYFLSADKKVKNLITYIYLEEITMNTWKKTKYGLKQDDCL